MTGSIKLLPVFRVISHRTPLIKIIQQGIVIIRQRNINKNK